MTTQAKTQLELTPPWFDVERNKSGLIFRVKGAWFSRTVSPLEPELQDFLSKESFQKIPVQVIIEKECVMDSAGACLIARVIKNLRNQGCGVELPEQGLYPLLDQFLAFKPIIRFFNPRLNWKTRWLDHIGYKAVVLQKTAKNMLRFLGEVMVTWGVTFRSLAHIRWVSVARQSEEIGVKALPIVGLISFLIGMVLAYQSINQLRKFGAEIYTIDFLGISILREIAVLLTAIVIAGRSGSAFTAQIGTMRLNQEVDAIQMLGLNPVLILVIPRLIAILLSLPLLVFFAMIMGLFGGMLVTSLIIGISSVEYVSYLQKAVSVRTFWVGMSKAPLFALLIGLVGCYRGFQVRGSAESVGTMTTQSVVESIFLVIVCDAFMSIIFSYLGI